MSIRISEKEILSNPNDQDLGEVIRNKYWSLKRKRSGSIIKNFKNKITGNNLLLLSLLFLVVSNFLCFYISGRPLHLVTNVLIIFIAYLAIMKK